MLDYGANVNLLTVYDNIPLTSAVMDVKISTKKMKPVYLSLLRAGSDYQRKDKWGNSVLDYAMSNDWRPDFLDIIKEFEDENK